MDATGNAAGVTEQQMLDLAAGIQQTTRFGDEAVTSATALLLSLSSIGGEQVPRAVRALTDMATILGVDLNQAATTLSKALEGNVSALQRYGVRVDKDMIEQLKAAGREAEAFDLILGKLEDRFGGAAVAARQTLGGALDALKNAFGDLFELGSQSQPLTESIEKLTTLLQDDSTKQAVLDLGQGFVDAFGGAVTVMRGVVKAFQDIYNLDFAGLFKKIQDASKAGSLGTVGLSGGGIIGYIQALANSGNYGSRASGSRPLPQRPFSPQSTFGIDIPISGITGDLPFNPAFSQSIKEVNDRMLEYGVIAGKARRATDTVAESAGKAGKKFREKAESVDHVINLVNDLNDAGKNFVGSFIQGIIDGKNAVDALSQSLKKVGDTLFSKGFNQLWDALLPQNGAGGGLFGGLIGGISSALGISTQAATGGATAPVGAVTSLAKLLANPATNKDKERKDDRIHLPAAA